MYAQVIVDIASSAVDKVFDYLCPFSVEVGNEVLVPFAGRNISGIVVSLSSDTTVDKSKIKPIMKILDGGIPSKMVQLATFIKQQYYVGLSDALRLFLPRKIRGEIDRAKTQIVLSIPNEEQAKNYTKTLPARSQKQKDLVEYLLTNKETPLVQIAQMFGRNNVKTLENAQIIARKTANLSRNPEIEELKSTKPTLTATQQKVIKTILSKTGTYLIHGVTGCGKTEVYLSLAEHVLSSNKNVIILVPEISLTPQMFGLVKGRFKDQVAVLHSGLSEGERYDEWKRIQSKQARVVIGARSALFAPLDNIGLIVIDEEHDDSYKSETNPRYDARTVAQKLSELHNCSLVLGSATPSLESYSKALSGEYQLLEMPNRVNGAQMPPIEIVDMTREFQLGNTGILSHSLQDAIQAALDSNEQVMLFQNRRGTNSFIQCKECGWVATCPNCDVSLVYHKAENALKCHFCGNRFHVFTSCPQCKSDKLVVGSPGTQKVVEELEAKFPQANILRMDNDTTRGKNGHAKILEQFRNKQANILVGTQMIAKGHDFPSVTLVGIIDADISLHQSSYSAAEHTFSLITQVAGRAGRAQKLGRVILQTRSPRHYIYRFAKEYDYLAFFKKEANLREITKYPPYAKILRILIKSNNQEVAKNSTMLYYEKVKKIREQNPTEFYYLGAMKSPVGKIENQYRYQILMRLKNNSTVEKQIHEIMPNQTRGYSVFVETNPTNLS